MNNLEKVSAELLASLDEIRVAHGYILIAGRRVCNECHQLWPCRTATTIIRSSTTGVWHMSSSLAHVQDRIGRTELILQKIDEYFSAMNNDLAEQVISLTHKLCIAKDIQVFGFLNALGEIEFQVERVVEEEPSLPLWSLMIGRQLGVRIFSPIQNQDSESFFENILHLGFAQPDVSELVEWWKQLTAGSNRYVTSSLPKDTAKSCELIIQLCQATAQFCDEDWSAFNELF